MPRGTTTKAAPKKTAAKKTTTSTKPAAKGKPKAKRAADPAMSGNKPGLAAGVADKRTRSKALTAAAETKRKPGRPRGS